MLNVGILLAIAYATLCVMLYFRQDTLLFFPTTAIDRTPAENGRLFEEVLLPVREHATCAWFVPASAGSRGTVLFSHGNAGNIGDRIESIEIWIELGFDVLIYDYGGYGKSTGAPSEARCYEDIRASHRWLVESKGVEPDRLVLFGRSLGAGPTLQLAKETECAAVIVESTFRSVPQLGSEVFWWLPVKLLARNRFDNESKIAQVNAPVLVAHSPDDTIIPYPHGRALFEAAREPKSFLEFRGDHNEGFWISGDTYRLGLDGFLSSHLSNAPR